MGVYYFVYTTHIQNAARNLPVIYSPMLLPAPSVCWAMFRTGRQFSFQHAVCVKGATCFLLFLQTGNVSSFAAHCVFLL